MRFNLVKLMVSLLNFYKYGIETFSFDQRVHKVCTSLHNAGYNILLVGRVRKKSVPLEREYKIRRFKYIPERGVFFYAVFNIMNTV